MTHPQQWEYLTIAERNVEVLTALGSQGWELVGVDSGWLFFKRPALSFRERVTLDQKRRYYGMVGVPFEEEEGSDA